MSASLNTPFRVYANNNLGTEFDYTHSTGEWTTAKSTGQAAILPQVNLATGNLTVSAGLIKTQEQIGDWDIGFVYNAQNQSSWTSNIPVIKIINKSTIAVRQKDGSFVNYTWNNNQNAYVAPSGGESKPFIQKQADGTFVHINPKNNERKIFSAEGKLQSIYDARGRSMQYRYDENNNLQSIASAAGVYQFSKTNTTITLNFTETGKTSSKQLAQWVFDDKNRITSTTIGDSNGYQIHYAYEGTTSQLKSITQDDQTSLHFSYSQDNPAKIKAIQQGQSGSPYCLDYSKNKTIITDPLGFSATATLNAQSNISTFSQQVGDTPTDAKILTTICNYSGSTLQSIQKPNGALTAYKTNQQGLATEIKKPNGQTIQNDYDVQTGACLIKRELVTPGSIHSKWAATRFIYENSAKNGLFSQRLRFKISPMGCVTEYRYSNDDQVQLTSKRIYINNAIDLSTLSDTQTFSYEQMTAWVSQQPADQISLQTFTENYRGQRTQMQTFTTINPDGTGKNTNDAGNTQSQDITIWGGIKTLSEKLDAKNTAKTEKMYDDLHRLISHDNALNEKREIIFDDKKQQVTLTQPNGRTETSVWDDTGNITTTITQIPGSDTKRITMNQYDKAGRRIVITAIDGQITYQLFDSVNRLRFTITPMGRVQEHFYDDINRYHQMTHYYNAVPAASLKTPPTFDWITKNLIIDSTQDVHTYQSFDLSGRLQCEVDGRGAITEHRYDIQNRKTAEILYANQITKDELTALQTGQLTKIPTPADNAEILFYDQDNHVVVTQGSMGHVTHHQRNVAGFEIHKHCYAAPTNLMWDGKLQLPSATADDFSQYYYRDARGQNRLTVDGVDNAHYVARYFYMATGKTDTVCQYANQASAAPAIDSNPFDLLPEKNAEDRQTSYDYDLLQRVAAKHLPEQRLEIKKYDDMDHEVLSSTGDDPDQLPKGAPIQTQANAKHYDNWGQLSAEVSPLLYEKIADIHNNDALSEAEKEAQIADVWKNQAIRHIHDEKTGLHTATLDVAADDADFNDPAVSLFYRDLDQRVVLTVGPEGQAKTTHWHPAFDKETKTHRYANAIDADQQKTLTGGFITDDVRQLLVADKDHDAIDQYEYDGAGGETKHVDPDNYETKTKYHMFGHWCEQQHPVHDTAPSLTMTREVNAAKQITVETQTADSKSIATEKIYDNLHGACTRETDANGAATIHAYEPRGVRSSTTNALNRKTSIEHDAFRRETKVILPLGNSVTTRFDQASRTQITMHLDKNLQELIKTVKSSDAFGNVVATQDAQGLITRASFNAANQVTAKKDAAGNRACYTRDRHGLLRTKTRTYTNTKQSETTTYTYTKSKKEKTRTQAAKSLALKTTHDWNALGQRFRTKAPNGNLCLTDFNKRSLAAKHHACLDAKAASTAKPGTPVVAVVTEQNYNAQRKTNTITQYTHGKTQQFTQTVKHDGFNRVHQKIVDPNALKLTHTTDLDNAGHVIALTDPKGQVTYQIRDVIGNLRFEINPKGGVTEHRYDENNQLTFTTQYATVVDLTKVSKGMTEADFEKLITPTKQDRQTFCFYDDLGNERFRLNRNGAVIEKRYNKNGQEIATIQYYNQIKTDPTTLTTDQLIEIGSQIADTSKDKATFRVLDAIGQERFIFNAEGCVIEKRYFGAPHTVTHEIQYATPVTNAQDLATLSIEAILEKLTLSKDADRHSYWMHDELNRLQFHISATGAVTRYDYDSNTENKTCITEFAATLDLSNDYDTLQAKALALIADSKTDKVEKRFYDQANREIQRIHAAGSDFEKSESWEYDGASRKTKHTTVTGLIWEYESDGANRLVKEYSPQTTVYQTTIDSKNVTGIDLAKNEAACVIKNTDYDENGNPICLTSSTEFDEHQALFAYDGLDKKIKDTWPELAIDDPHKSTSLTVRPETTQAVSKQTVYNAFGAKLIEINEAGNALFYCYNTQGHLIYRVNQEGYVAQYIRNAFGEAEIFIFYSTKLSIDLTSYKETGLTAEIIIGVLQKDPANDRSYHQTFNRMGKVTQVQQDAVVCYIPNDDVTQSPSVSKQNPTKTTNYNAFGDEIAHAILLDQNTQKWSTTLTWTNALGKPIATVKPDGVACVYDYDARGRLISTYIYATRIAADKMPTTKTTYAQLQALLVPLADINKDHETLTPRDILGRKSAEQITHEVVQSVSGQSMRDLDPQTLSKTFTYTDDDKIKTITYANGGVEIHYYDERRFLVAKVMPVRSQVQPDATVIKIRPIEYYRYNAHGKRVETYKPYSGCNVDVDPKSDVVPLPISTDDQKDFRERFFRDARGQIQVHLKANGALSQNTFTETSKLARTYHPTTSADQKNPKENITAIDEHRFERDKLDRTTKTTMLRDNVEQSVTQLKQDAFSVIAEGPGNDIFPVQHKTDQAGRKWSTMNEKGGTVLVGHDAAGNDTVKISAQEISLADTHYQDLPEVMSKREEISGNKLTHEFQEIHRDAASRPIALVEPGVLDSQMQAPLAPKSILLSNSKHLPQFGEQSLSFAAHIDPNHYEPKLKLTDEDGVVTVLSMKLCQHTQRWGVDIGKLPKQKYQVDILHQTKVIDDETPKSLPYHWQTKIDFSNTLAAASTSSPYTLAPTVELNRNTVSITWDHPIVLPIEDAWVSVTYQTPYGIEEHDISKLVTPSKKPSAMGMSIDEKNKVTFNLPLSETATAITKMELKIKTAGKYLTVMNESCPPTINRFAHNTQKKQLLQITHNEPLPNNPQLHIWEAHFGQPGVWKKISLISIDKSSQQLLIDSSALHADHYRYHLGDPNKIHEFSVKNSDEKTLLANAYKGTDKIVRPVHQIAWNAFDKKSATTTPSGDTTKFEHNKREQLTHQINPEITVTDEHGKTSNVQPETHIGYDEIGGKVGERDANNHTQTWRRNEAGEEVSRIAADGVPFFINTLDTQGHATAVTSASGNTWRNTVNAKGKVTVVIQPSGDIWNNELNENNFTIRTIPPIGSARGIFSYAQGPFGDMSAEFLPMGEQNLYAHDRKHQMLTHAAINSKGTTDYTLKYQRDYWSKITQKIDGTGSVYQYDYFNTGDLAREYGVSLKGHGQMPVFDSTTNHFTTDTVDMPLQDIHYTYLTSLRPREIIDDNTVKPQKLIKTFDINRHPFHIKETTGAGNVLRETAMTFNAMHWPLIQADTNFSLESAYDAVSNRRRLNASYQPEAGDPNPYLSHDAYFSYDVADRTLISDGILDSETKNIITQWSGCQWGYNDPNRGINFTYQNGLLHTQSPYLYNSNYQYTNTAPLAITLHRDKNEMVSEVTGTSLSQYPMQFDEKISYTPDGFFESSHLHIDQKLVIVNPFPPLDIVPATVDINPLLQLEHNANGRLYHYHNNARLNAGAGTYSDFDADGQPGAVNSFFDIPNAWRVNDNLTNQRSYFDNSVITQQTGTRSDKYGHDNNITSKRLFDTRNLLNAVTNISNVFDPNDERPHTRFMDNSLDGRLLTNWDTVFYGDGTLAGTTPNKMFHDTVGHVTALYKEVKKYLTQEAKMVLQVTANPVKPFGISSLCAQLPSTVVEAGDSWESISQRVFGDPNLSAIVSAYSGVQLTPGQQIETKQIIDAFNKAGDSTPYNQLIGAIYNSLYPNLHMPQPPKPHDSFWDEVIGIVVSIVVMVAIPALAGEILGVMGPILEGMIYGVAGAIASAASQGVAIAFGDQQGFSISDMIENGATAGLTAGISDKLGINNMLSKAEYPKAFASTVTVGVTVQLFEMSIGLRKSFDAKLIIEQATASILRAKIDNSKAMKKAMKSLPTVVEHASDELTDSVVGAAVGQRPDLTALAANIVGDEAGDDADKLASHHLSSHADENEQHHGNTPNAPVNYAQQARSIQASHLFNAGSKTKDDYDRFMDDSLKAQEKAIERSLHSSNESRMHELEEAVRRVDGEHATHHTNWENRLAEEIYTHQNSNWARGIMGFAGMMNSNTMHIVALNGANTFTRDLMGDVAGSYGTRYFDDLQNGRSTFSDAMNFVGAELDVQTLGEVGGVALGSAMRFVNDELPGVARNWASMFGESAHENTRQLSRIERISSNKINKGFINEDAAATGWLPPYPDNLSMRKITTATELKFYRVHADPDRVAGRFFAREKEIAPFLNNPEALRIHLGLPDAPIYITDVNVPAGAELLVGKIGPQPTFGLIEESGFQYQAIGKLPLKSFANTRSILESRLNFTVN